MSVDFAGSSYFRLIGLSPALGRAFEPREDVTGGPPAAIVSHRLWTSAFGGDPSIVGKPVTLSGAPVTIVGVGPRGFGGIVAGHAVDFWVSLSSLAPLGGEYAGGTLQRRDDHWFNILARLKPGVAIEQARAAAAVTAARLGREYPEHHKGRKLTVFRASEVRLQPRLDGSLYPAGAALMTIAGLVLLVGCTNLAGLLLARGLETRPRAGHPDGARIDEVAPGAPAARRERDARPAGRRARGSCWPRGDRGCWPGASARLLSLPMQTSRSRRTCGSFAFSLVAVARSSAWPSACGPRSG